MSRYSPRWLTLFLLLLLFALLLPAQRHVRAAADSGATPSGGAAILFVTQPPIRADFTTISSTFGNHQSDMASVGRGGDLWSRYPDGTLKNLTAAAGYGSDNPDGFQDEDAIAVRDPAVHWNGEKAVFSMVIGAPTEQYVYEEYYWQLYEITGLGAADTPVITKVPNQPELYNNVSPIYGTDDRIIFTSDRPRNGARHLYPQLDEYETAPTVSGLWSLDPTTGNLRLLNHAPSGDFTPTVDSFGRVLFTQWDHMQRDQQADTDDLAGTSIYGTFDYSDESAGATILDTRTELFPEPRSARSDLLAGTNLVGHSFNHFFPWTVLEDGSEGEVLNHLGRQELHDYIANAINDDPNIVEYYGQYPRTNPNPIDNLFQIKEDPTQPGRYYGVDAPEFYTHAAGQVVRLDAPPGRSADSITVEYITHRDTASTTPSPNHSGHYRDPLPLSDGTLVAVHTPEQGEESGSGPPLNSSYDFRLKRLQLAGNGFWEAGSPLTSGISKAIRYWSPDVMVEYDGPLWELNPVEVRPRPRPTRLTVPLPLPEQSVFDQVGVSVAEMQQFLRANNLALIVSRDVTTRDDLDYQQPFNLRVWGTEHQTTGASGTLYDVGYLQLFQADQLRGWTGGGDTARDGRRVLARHLHDPAALDANPLTTGPTAAFPIADDGSVAAFVPAQRALTWQLTDEAGQGVVRERYWVTFQPGEIRVCASCHGLNESDQAGNGAPTNEPQALYTLLEQWQDETPSATLHLFLPLLQR